MKFIPTNISEVILKPSLSHRKGIVFKFFVWSEESKDIPTEIRLLVFDFCLFQSLRYAVETWKEHLMH